MVPGYWFQLSGFQAGDDSSPDWRWLGDEELWLELKYIQELGPTKFGDRLWNARDWFQGPGIKKQMVEGVRL